MSDDSDTVFVRSQRGGDDRRPHHTDRNCDRLQQAVSVLEKERSVLPDDHPECSVCAGERENDMSTGPQLCSKIAKMNPEDVGLSPLGERADQPGGAADD
ncbi:hypothetical protein SAMN06269185_3320 [Natronoarchaeum philippinense]|uniref:Uncharacterized protein n=1 Tax=Natronoarchaeum philippinense TaxID=558529 RepID=A0A285P972_NATPI|nr:hypothetical protein [Natronoarchaeum philippinense]SNZ18285.1 hypothetical protein SAMN06269185_3320 [Natronoarchaeum philippinense]